MILDLEKYSNSETIGATARSALEFVKASAVTREKVSENALPSLHYGKIYAFRQKLARYDPSKFVGLEESIDLLSENDIPVYLYTLQTDLGVVVAWLKEDMSPLALMIIKGMGADG